MQQLMTLEEAASYLRLKHSTLYKLIQKGKVPALKVGGAWRFKKDTLDDWLNSQSRQTHAVVLVVDDDPRVRDILKDIIIEQGYEVVAVDNGERAVEEMERQDFGLVFLDLVLPGSSGVEVLKKLKVKDYSVPVAIVTGYGDYSIAMEAMALGPVLLIRKPFNVEDIVLVLNMVMKVRR